MNEVQNCSDEVNCNEVSKAQEDSVHSEVCNTINKLGSQYVNFIKSTAIE